MIDALTPEHKALQRHRRIVGLKHLGEQTFLGLGQELYHFEREKQYLLLDYPSFNSYLADPDINIAPRTAYRLKGVYQKYILEMGMEPDRLRLIWASAAGMFIVGVWTFFSKLSDLYW